MRFHGSLHRVVWLRSLNDIKNRDDKFEHLSLEKIKLFIDVFAYFFIMRRYFESFYSNV